MFYKIEVISLKFNKNVLSCLITVTTSTIYSKIIIEFSALRRYILLLVNLF